MTAPVGAVGGGSIGSIALTSKLIFWAFFVSIGAVLVLVAIDRRQPARRRHVVPRAVGEERPLPTTVVVRGRRRPVATAAVREAPTVLYRRTPIWRRFLALIGLGAMGTAIGAIVAIVLAGLAIAVLWALSGAAR